MSEVVIPDSRRNLIENFHKDVIDHDLDEESIDLSLLRLNSFGGSPELRRKPSSRLPFSSALATVCGIPFKRQSPENDSVEEPKPKKLFLQPRFESDPIPSCERIPFCSSSLKRNGFSVAATVSRRCVSDLTSSPSKTASMCSTSSSMMGSETTREERSSKSDQMLMIVKDGARQMTDWCGKLLQYGEGLGFEGQNRNSNLLHRCENEIPCVLEQIQTSKEAEESKEEFEGGGGVKAERISDALVLEFSCGCRRSYRILFSGDECYYKLL